MSERSQEKHILTILSQMQEMVQAMESHLGELEFDMSELGFEGDWMDLREHFISIDTSLSTFLPGLQIDLEGDEYEAHEYHQENDKSDDTNSPDNDEYKEDEYESEYHRLAFLEDEELARIIDSKLPKNDE